MAAVAVAAVVAVVVVVVDMATVVEAIVVTPVQVLIKADTSLKDSFAKQPNWKASVIEGTTWEGNADAKWRRLNHIEG